MMMCSEYVPTNYNISMQPPGPPGAIAIRAISDPTEGDANANMFRRNCAEAALEIQTAAANRDRLPGGRDSTSPTRVTAIHITGAAFLRTIGKGNEGCQVASIRRQQVSACLGSGAAVKCASTQLLLLPTNQPTNRPTNQCHVDDGTPAQLAGLSCLLSLSPTGFTLIITTADPTTVDAEVLAQDVEVFIPAGHFILFNGIHAGGRGTGEWDPSGASALYLYVRLLPCLLPLSALGTQPPGHSGQDDLRLHLHLLSRPSNADFGARMLDHQLSSEQVTRAQAMDSLVPLSELVAQASPWPWGSGETRDQVLDSSTPRILKIEQNESLAPGAATAGGFAPGDRVRYEGLDGGCGGLAFVVGGSGGVAGHVVLRSRGQVWPHPVELVAGN